MIFTRSSELCFLFGILSRLSDAFILLEESWNMDVKNRQKIVEEYRLKETDTGSTEVQIALLTYRINHLVEHLKKHKKDFHTKRGLLVLVGRRRRLISYLNRKSRKSLLDIAGRLGIKVKV